VISAGVRLVELAKYNKTTSRLAHSTAFSFGFNAAAEAAACPEQAREQARSSGPQGSRGAENKRPARLIRPGAIREFQFHE
jgi:hypothetical protein